MRVGLLSRGGEGMADRSRMNREIHVRICGGLEVRVLRSTRRVPRGTEGDKEVCESAVTLRRDGGGPSKAALQGEALNRPKLLR